MSFFDPKQGNFSLKENQTPLPCPTWVHEILMPSYRAPFETSEYQFSTKVIFPFFFYETNHNVTDDQTNHNVTDG